MGFFSVRSTVGDPEYHWSTVQAKKTQFFSYIYHHLLNVIWFFASMGHFWKIPCPSKTFLLPICLLCACKGRERVFPFCLRVAALCMVLLRRFKILLGRWIGGYPFQEKKELFGTIYVLGRYWGDRVAWILKLNVNIYFKEGRRAESITDLLSCFLHSTEFSIMLKREKNSTCIHIYNKDCVFLCV